MSEPLAGMVPPDPDAPKDTPPKAEKATRPTTRAGRKAAAAKRAAAKKDKPPTPTARPRKAALETRLADSLITLGTVVAATGSMAGPAFTQDGYLIVGHAPEVASALSQMADNDPRVKVALERMLTAGTYSALMAAVTPLALGIAANHGVLPVELADRLGAYEPIKSKTSGPPPPPPAPGVTDLFGPGPTVRQPPADAGN